MSSRFSDSLPSELVAHVNAMCGRRGELWFEELPQVIADLERKWNVAVGRPFPGIEFNYVAGAVGKDGEALVIKIAPPFETVEIYGEAMFLRVLAGRGAVRLFNEDRELNAILIERAEPGKALHEAFESSPIDCVEPAIAVLKRILQPPPAEMSDVVTLDTWFKNFRRYQETDFPKDLAEKALQIYERISQQSDRTFYIHGDLHPGNVVTAQREKFLAIDPKGIVGHVGYDIAVFLINLERWQRKAANLEELLSDAICRFASAFEFTEGEIREWVFVHMVIAAWWNFEDMSSLFDPELAMPGIWHL